MFHAAVVVALRMLLTINRCKMDRNHSESFKTSSLLLVILICVFGLAVALYTKAMVDEYLIVKHFGLRVEVKS